jgi:aspartate ammonia-lyase
VPLIARNLLDSIKLLAAASRLLNERCVAGLEADRERCEEHVEATLVPGATALAPHIGYDQATEIIKEAAASGRTLREVASEKGVDDETLAKALDYHALARPHGA